VAQCGVWLGNGWLCDNGGVGNRGVKNINHG